MKNRFLLIGDGFWGETDTAPDLMADLMLCREPAAPLQFLISNHTRNTWEHLFQTCPREIIGRQAGTTILCLGWSELLQNPRWDESMPRYEKLLHEILHNSQSVVTPCTIPTFQLEEATPLRYALSSMNAWLRGHSMHERLKVFDLEAICQDYLVAQQPRGAFVRGIFDELGRINRHGQVLMAERMATSLARQ